MDKANAQYLSKNEISISVRDLFGANPVVWRGLDGLADTFLYMQNDLYCWVQYFDSTRVALQSMINKGVEAFKKHE